MPDSKENPISSAAKGIRGFAGRVGKGWSGENSRRAPSIDIPDPMSLSDEDRANFGIQVNNYVAERMADFGLEPKFDYDSPLENDTWEPRKLSEVIHNLVRQSVDDGAVDIWQSNVQNAIRGLETAHIRATAVETLQTYFDKLKIPFFLSELQKESSETIASKLRDGGLGDSAIEQATAFIHSQFEDKATTRVDVEQYAADVRDFKQEVAEFEGEESLSFEGVMDVDEAIGLIQVNKDDEPLRVIRSNLQAGSLDVAFSITGGEKIEPNRVVVTDKNQEKIRKQKEKGSDSKVIGAGKWFGRHKLITVGAAGLAGAALIGSGVVTRSGGDNGGSNGALAPEPTHTRTVESTPQSGFVIETQTASPTVSNTPDNAATSGPSSNLSPTPDNIPSTLTRTAVPTASATPGFGQPFSPSQQQPQSPPVSSVAPVGAELSSKLTHEQAVDAIDLADGEKDGMLNVTISDIGSNFDNDLARILKTTGINTINEDNLFENGAGRWRYTLAASGGEGDKYRQVFAGDVIGVNPATIVDGYRWDNVDLSNDLRMSIATGAANQSAPDPQGSSKGSVSAPETGNGGYLSNGGSGDYEHEPTSTSGSESTAAVTANCILRDVHGEFDQSDTIAPVTGNFYNIAENDECRDNIFVWEYGTNRAPEDEEKLGTGEFVADREFIKSQTLVEVHNVTVTRGNTNVKVEFQATDTDPDLCWRQYDIMDEPNAPETDPAIEAVNSIVVKNPACEPTPVPTDSPTPTDTPRPTDTAIPTGTPTEKPRRYRKTATPTKEPTSTPSPITTETPKVAPPEPSPTPPPARADLPKAGYGMPDNDSYLSQKTLWAMVAALSFAGAASIRAGINRRRLSLERLFGQNTEEDDEDEEKGGDILNG